jgi:hypothetical protein
LARAGFKTILDFELAFYLSMDGIAFGARLKVEGEILQSNC